MKTFKIASVILLCMAITLVSCDGEDGRPGEDGYPGESITGAPGADGVPGADGDPGESITGTPGANGINCWDLNGNGIRDVGSEDLNDDGNVDINDCAGTDTSANVQKFDIELDGFWPDFRLGLPMPIPLEERDNYAFFFYIRTFPLPQVWLPVPGRMKGDVYTDLVYEATEDNFFSYDLQVDFHNDDNSEHEIQEGEYSLFRIIAIEYSNLGGKANKVSLESTLKSAGVDTSDYNAMADYFGLE